MKSFLEECASDILQKYDKDDSVCVVFPNKRTMVYFRKEYAKLKNQVSFAKNLYPVDKILQQFLKFNQADDLTLLFELYKAFKEVFDRDGMKNRNIAADFNAFFDTGQKLLADFNEIDNYLVDIDQLCHNCADLNELDAFYAGLDEKIIGIIRAFWANFSSEKLSREKLRFYELWVNLPKVYNIFKARLKELGCSYSGMHKREICALIKKGGLETRFKTYIFVGFNVLNKAERKIFTHLRLAGKAKFYWDADNYYISDSAQEAGLFMRGYLSDYPNELYPVPPDNILLGKKNVEFIGCPLEISQSKVVHDILLKFRQQPDYKESKTAVVLGDEHLLFPILSSIPQKIEKINVTMGFPFKETPVFSFLNNCLQLKNNERTGDYYFKDVLGVLNHPFVCKLPDFHSKLITKKINDERKIRITKEFLGSFSHVLNLIFNSEVSTPADLLKNVLEILSEIYFIKNPEPEDNPKIENEFIYQAYLSIKNLYNNILKLPLEGLESRLVISILRQHLSQIKIPFDSKDDDGIQIIGMMETRNIDFDNVILTGMNEGVFPKRSENTSFITESMRLAFDMPIVKFKDAVFGYFFYRLFQRAKNVIVLYNNVFANNLSGEMSRFATQILKEASKPWNPKSNFEILERQFSRTVNPSKDKETVIKNSDEIFEKLKPYLTKGEGTRALSPSALNTYIACPLKFYFQYIAKLSPVEELEEEADQADFGTVLHRTVELLYSPFCGKTISKNEIEALKYDKEKCALEAFNQHFMVNNKSKADLSGLDAIFFEVLLAYVDRILDYDKKNAPLKIVKTEDPVYGSIPFVIDGKKYEANIGGIVDRADFVESTKTFRIVDYKTGNVIKHLTFKNIDSLFDGSLKDRSSEGFQVFLYSYVYMKKYPSVVPLPVIYSVRQDITDLNTRFSMSENKIRTEVNTSNIKELTDKFALNLQSVLARLFDKKQTFQAMPGDNCKYCDFKSFCGK